MNLELLRKHIALYLRRLQNPSPEMLDTIRDRRERTAYYQSWTDARLRAMGSEDLLEYLSRLWAMLIWGNKQYVVDKLIASHGLETVRNEIATLVWSDEDVATRWDRFRSRIKGMGPAMMSELLAHVHPDECLLWNRRAYIALDYLGVAGLPKYNYQVTGKKYVELCALGRELALELENAGMRRADMLEVDYFIWDELQVEEGVSQITRGSPPEELVQAVAGNDPATAEFIHDEVKDKLADIGQWLGFASKTEVKVADGSVVDTVWESTIGNMGRVIYVFEVQTKGSIDSLLMNLLKALNNAAVQGIVAVSDAAQIEKIRKHAAGVAVLRDKLRYWDYVDVLATHEALERVNESINKLGLVPQGLVGGN